MIKVQSFQIAGHEVSIYLTEVPNVIDHRTSNDSCLRVRAIEVLQAFSLIPAGTKPDPWTNDRELRMLTAEVFPTHIVENVQGIGYGFDSVMLPWRALFNVEPSDRNFPGKVMVDMQSIRISECIESYWRSFLKMCREKGMKIHRRDDETGEETITQYAPNISPRLMHDLTVRSMLEKSFEDGKTWGLSGVCVWDVKNHPTDFLNDAALAIAIGKYCRRKVSWQSMRAILVTAGLLERSQQGKRVRYELTAIGQTFAAESPRMWHRSVITWLDGLELLS
jgi:hypothetical protein